MSKLYFYYSAMNAGKSTTLLQSSYNYRERGMNTIIFTPAVDDRYEVGHVTSRIGLKSDAVSFGKEFDFFAYTQEAAKQAAVHCVLVDEAQFLYKAQVEQLTRICDELDIPVLAYGLRSSYSGDVFEGSLYLLAWADELNEIKTICHCGKKASMNMLVDKDGNRIADGPQIVIGGNEKYVSTCRKHFTLGISKQRDVEKEKIVEGVTC